MEGKYSGFSVQMAAGKNYGDAHALRAAVHTRFFWRSYDGRDSIFIKKRKKSKQTSAT